MVDMVVHRHQLRDQLARLLRLLTDPQPSAEVVKLPTRALDIPAKPAS